MEISYTKLNNLLGWTCCFLASTVFFLTKEPTASFWDCGEFIAAAYKLQIVHQPGAPLFLLIQNLFSNFAFANTGHIAYWMNTGAALCSGLTILFLFWTITALAKKVMIKNQEMPRVLQTAQIMGSGIVGALAYAFSDTFWFSAVESEVYAMSSLSTALIFWLILKWENHAHEARADKWLILIAFIMGLSIGVHLLNLLTIPVIALVIYFRTHEQSSTKGILKTLGLSFLILAFMLWGVIQYLVMAAAQFDFFFVNQLGLSFGSGITVFAMLLIAAIVLGIRYSINKNKPRLNLALICFSFVLFGYSSFALVVIRAAANPPLNNYAPDNIFSFLEYVARDQYVATPLITGKYFDSKPIAVKNGANIYRKDQDKYTIIGNKPVYEYDRSTLFPRVHSSEAGRSHPQFYRSWLNFAPSEQPTFISNLQFFFTYQSGVMFWRYFMWNFVGRQNDESGQLANLKDGNWLSGIKPIDNLRLGGQYALPQSAQNDPSANHFYFLPLLLGIMGLLWHYRSSKRDMTVVGLLFFFTGLAIVLYLNDTPMQPRERDYVYAGAFYAFAIWIGLSVMAITKLINNKTRPKLAAILAVMLAFFMAPALMLKEGWDDHDRSHRYTTRDLYARNYLESCEPNAILFTIGDNDTFPLWYAQEVENIRPDVRIVNLGYLSSDWYVKQMREQMNASAPLPISIPREKIDKGVRDYLEYEDYGISQRIEIKDLLEVMLSDHPNDKSAQSGRNFLPTKKMKLAVNKQDVLKNKVVPKAWEDAITDSMEWDFNQDYITRTHLAFFDILVNNKWERPIYFNAMPSSELMGLDKYLVNEGLVLKLMPITFNEERKADEIPQAGQLTNIDALHDNLMRKYQWADINKLTYLDPITRNIIPQFTSNFNLLSRELLENKQHESAREVANKCLDVLPKQILSMNQAVDFYFLSDTLYEVDDTEKANDLVKRNADYVSEQLTYQLAIAQDKKGSHTIDEKSLRLGMGIMHALLENTKKHKQTAIENHIAQQYAKLEKEIAETI